MHIHTSTRSSLYRTICLLLLSLPFSGWLLGNWESSLAEQPGAATPQPHPRGNKTLADALNPDGTMKAGLAGSYDPRGYRLAHTALRAPRFVPATTCPGWSDRYEMSNGTDGTVSAIVVSGDDVYLGGLFTYAGNVLAHNVARFNQRTNTWSALESNDGRGVQGSVMSLALQGNTLFVGGNFGQVNVGANPLTANAVAKFDLATHTWSALASLNGNGVYGSVNALALKDDEVYVGGYFDAVNEGPQRLAVANIASFNTRTNTWHTLGAGQVDRMVTALALCGDVLYVGGHFEAIYENSTMRLAAHLAKFDTSTNRWGILGSEANNGVNLAVFALATNGESVFAGGAFTAAYDASGQINVNYVVRYEPATNRFSALASSTGNGVNGHPLALAANANEVYLGGNFLKANAGNAPIEASHLARFDTRTNTWQALSSSNGNGVGNSVSVISLNGSAVYFGGGFTEINSGSAARVARRIARYDQTTQAFSAFTEGASQGIEGQVNVITVVGDELYVGGNFFLAGDVSARGIAKFNTKTLTWSALGGGVSVGGERSVQAIAVAGDEVYVGGLFSFTVNDTGTTQVQGLAKFNLTTQTWGKVGPDYFGIAGVNGTVKAIAVHGDDIFVGGYFTHAYGPGGLVPANGVARWNKTTNTWSALGTGNSVGVYGAVLAMAVQGEILYVGGEFSQVNWGGAAVTASAVAQYDLLTNTWNPLRSATGNGVAGGAFTYVAALVVSGNDVYVGGDFSHANAGSNAFVANHIARFNTVARTWHPLASADGVGIETTPYDYPLGVAALTLHGSDLFVGGGFSEVNGGNAQRPARGVAKFNTQTQTWSALTGANETQGVDGSVRAVGAVRNQIYVGGSFKRAGEHFSLNFGGYCFDSPPTLLVNPLARLAGQPGFVSLLGSVSDMRDAASSLSLSVNGGSSATVNGIQLSNLTLAAAGQLSAYVAADQTATTATFTTRVTDQSGGYTEAPLTVTVARASASLSNPVTCFGPGQMVAVSVSVENPNSVPLPIKLTATFTDLLGVPDSCQLTSCTVMNSGLDYTATLAPGQTVLLSYQARLADSAAPGTQVCTHNSLTFNGSSPLTLSACATVNCPASGPGELATVTSPASAQKPGSVLFYPIFTSSASAANTQNTRLSFTNTHPFNRSLVHLFFVDGATCSVADSFLCLTPNQTASFLAADLDPGTTGYIVAVAVDAQGCPTSFNYLLGEEFVKLSHGLAANLGAQSVTALAGGVPFCNPNATTAALRFDGVAYNVLPRTVALDNFPSVADGHDTLLILNRLGGDLSTGAAPLTNVFGLLYNDLEDVYSFSFSPNVCQLRAHLNANFPRIVPRLTTVIPAGRSGWLRLSSQNDQALSGAALIAHPASFSQGHTLHQLTTTNTAVYTIPIFPPGC